MRKGRRSECSLAATASTWAALTNGWGPGSHALFASMMPARLLLVPRLSLGATPSQVLSLLEVQASLSPLWRPLLLLLQGPLRHTEHQAGACYLFSGIAIVDCGVPF